MPLRFSYDFCSSPFIDASYFVTVVWIIIKDCWDAGALGVVILNNGGAFPSRLACGGNCDDIEIPALMIPDAYVGIVTNILDTDPGHLFSFECQGNMGIDRYGATYFYKVFENERRTCAQWPPIHSISPVVGIESCTTQCESRPDCSAIYFIRPNADGVITSCHLLSECDVSRNSRPSTLLADTYIRFIEGNKRLKNYISILKYRNFFGS